MPLAHANQVVLNEEIQFVDKTDGVIECDSLDLMCRQLEHENKDVANSYDYKDPYYKFPFFKDHVDMDRVSSFEKQMDKLDSTEKFLERNDIPIHDYLRHISCTTYSCSIWRGTQ